jgi:uncharacterized protein YbaR (Trm112 family)
LTNAEGAERSAGHALALEGENELTCQTKKKKILRMLVDSLQVFRPELTDMVVCPVCFKEVSLSNKTKITEANILPKATKGVIKTFLCASCNKAG